MHREQDQRYRGGGIEKMPARQLPGLAVDLAGQLAAATTEPVKVIALMKTLEEDLDLRDRELDRGFVRENVGETIALRVLPSSMPETRHASMWAL